MGNFFAGTRLSSCPITLTQKDNDPYVYVNIACSDFVFDPYNLLTRQWRLPYQDIQGKRLKHPLSNFELPPNIITRIEVEWESSISELEDYFRFRQSKYLKMLKRHSAYISKLHKSDTDAIIRYIRGNIMKIKYTKNSACFQFNANPGDSIDIATPEIYVVNNLTPEQKAFNDRHHVENIGLFQMKDVQSIMSVIQRAPQSIRHITLFRGVDLPMYYNAMVGQRLFHPSIMSTSLMKISSLNFVSGPTSCLLVLEVDTKHVRTLAIYNYFSDVVPMRNEFELLLPPVELEVIEVQTVNLDEILTPLEKRMAKNYPHFKMQAVKIVRVKVMKPKSVVFQWEQQCINVM